MASTMHEESSEERISNLDLETIPISDLRAGIVGWESQDDPAMPRNYSSARKWFIVAVLSSISMVTPFASAINSPAISSINREFGNTDSLLATLSVTIYLLGYAIGPLILAPLCELYGRKSVISTANICFCLFSIGCALAPNMAGLTVLRLLAGMGGSGCLTLGASVVSDMFPANARGRAMGILTCGPLLGPTLGPLVGGFIVSDMNWRWVFWVVVIIGSFFTTIFQFGATETNPRILVQRKTLSLRKQLGRDDLRSCYDTILTSQKKRQVQRVCNGLVQPAKLLFLSPLVLSLSIYIAFVYGTMYLLFTTVTLVFSHTYGFNERQTGLVFLSLGAGTVIGWLITTIWSDRDVARLVRANNGTYVPEMRLHITLGFAFLVPLTFFWYGWLASAQHTN